MKRLYRISTLFISGSGWLYDRLARFVSRRIARANGNGRQRILAGFLGDVEWDTGRLLYDGGSCSQGLISDDCMRSVEADNRHIDRCFLRVDERIPVKRSDRMWMVIEKDCSTANRCVRADDLLQVLALNPPKDLSPVRRRQRDKAIALVRDEALLEAAYGFNHLPLEWLDEGNRLCVGGEILPAPARLPKRGEVTALGCGACTLGPRLESRISGLFAEKKTAQAIALDYLGNELLLTLGRRMQADMQTCVRRQGLSLGQRLEFGGAEFDLSVQAAILRLAGAAEIGISLHRGSMLLPQKSTSVVFAIGHKLPRSARSS